VVAKLLKVANLITKRKDFFEPGNRQFGDHSLRRTLVRSDYK